MMNDTASTAKRVPIRRRVLMAVLAVTLAILAVSVIASVYFMSQMMREGEEALSEELSHNLATAVEQKASKTDTMLDAYKGYMEVIRDYTENLYLNRDELIASGKFVDSSRAETGKGVYAMQSAFAYEDYDLKKYKDEMYLLSHLESILEPMAKDNEEQITTIYLGTKSGLMISYDKWSYLSAVPKPDFYVYDYFDSEWYKKGMKENGVFFTSLYVDAMGRGLTITVATPFKDQYGEVQGVLAADFDITGLYNEMISMDFGNGSSSFAIDDNHKVIALDSEEGALLEEYVSLDDEGIKKLTSGKPGIIEAEDAFYAFAPIEDIGWTLCAKVPRTILMEKVESLDRSFQTAMFFFLLSSIVLVLAGVFFSNRVSKSITHPIELLVKDMQVIAEGNLNHKASVYRNDEIGDMTIRLNEMVEQLKGTIHDLETAQTEAAEMHELASTDSLTSVKSRIAYADYIQTLQDELDMGNNIEFGLGVFDCDNLKGINDEYGHDKGDEYLVAASHLICHIFKHSPVFRIGGDEFSVGLRGEDFRNRDALAEEFMREQRAICEKTAVPWEQVHVSMGIAVYDPESDNSAIDTMRRADKIMYEKKALQKTE